jgi:hypothetical protein
MAVQLAPSLERPQAKAPMRIALIDPPTDNTLKDSPPEPLVIALQLMQGASLILTLTLLAIVVLHVALLSPVAKFALQASDPM